jgi:glutamate-1-semialdehyde 2,1-aminomutase
MEKERKKRSKKSRELMNRAEDVLPGGVSSYARKFDFPLSFHRGSGSKIYDMDGQEYVDYLQAWGAIVLGHCDEAVTREATEILSQQDLHGVGTTELEVEVAEMIQDRVPSAERVLFGVTGSEAVARAITVARAATGRKKIIKFQGQYNGWYDSVAMNHLEGTPGSNEPFTAGLLDDVVDETIVLPFNDIDAVQESVEKNKGEIAGVILEPVSHNMGCIPPKAGFLDELREITRNNNIVLIFDEVITGFRHDRGGVQQIEDVTPDLTTMGKAVANGYPISVLCGREDLMNRFHTTNNGDVAFGGTYNSHPAALAAAKATLRHLDKREFYREAKKRRDDLCDGLEDHLEDHEIEASVVKYGTVFLTYFMNSAPTNHYDIVKDHNDQRYKDYRMEMIDQGIFMVPKPVRRNFLTESHTQEDVERTLEAADSVLKKIS